MLYNEMIIPIKNRSIGTFDMIIDDEDYEKIKHLNIRLNHTSNKNTKYAKAIIYKVDKVLDEPDEKGRTKIFKYDKAIHIHRFIMGLGDFKDDPRIINHKDGNGLNNSKSNLEICDTKYNSQSCRRRGKQGLVYFDTSMKRVKRWRATITISKVRHSKRFETEEEAEEWLENIKPPKEF